MPVIEIETMVNAPIKVVFDLSRSIDLHQLSTEPSQEKAIAGVVSGMIDMNETVTWRAKHFGVFQTLTSKITAFDSPTYFVDEMAKGIFKRFKHEHIFREKNGRTLMIDRFDYTSPLWILGNLADFLFLKRYMTHFLLERNKVIKEVAESEDRWKEILAIKKTVK